MMKTEAGRLAERKAQWRAMVAARVLGADKSILTELSFKCLTFFPTEERTGNARQASETARRALESSGQSAAMALGRLVLLHRIK